MIILTQRDLIKKVVSNWTRDYPPEVYDGDTFQGNALTQLHTLNLSTCSAEEVDKIVGSHFRTTYQCSECLQHAPVIVVVGQPDETWDRGRLSFKICKPCLAKAFALVQ